MSEHLRRTNAAATGQVGTEAGFLDAHFEACRPEYEAMLRSVGLQPGWTVLDAACGGGSYLPLLAETVGSGGAIAAFDLAPTAWRESNVSPRRGRMPVPLTPGSRR